MKLQPNIVRNVRLSDLQRDPNQPRKTFEPEGLKSLADSMLSGIQVPLIVRQNGKQLVIVDGERRWRAAKIAKIEALPCLLKEESDQLTIAAAQLTTAVQREELGTMDIARFLNDLQKRQKKSPNELLTELANRGITDVGREKLDSYLKLVELPEWAQTMLEQGELSETHAPVILDAMRTPKVLSSVKGSIAHALNWKGSVSVKELRNDLKRAHENIGINLHHTKSPYSSDDKNVRLFPIEQCRACPAYRKSAGGEYCVDPKLFYQKNETAMKLKVDKETERKARMKASGKPVPEPKADPVKVKQRAASRKESMRVYLEAFLRPVIERELPRRLPEPKMVALGIWLACGAIEHYQGKYYSGQREKDAARVMLPFLLKHNLTDLPEYMGLAARLDPPQHRSAFWREFTAQAAQAFTRDQVRWMARSYLSVELSDLGYTIDDGYLRLKRKAELIAFAKIGGLETVKDLGVGDLKKALLEPAVAKKIGVPEDLQKLYMEKIEGPPPLDADELDELTEADLSEISSIKPETLKAAVADAKPKKKAKKGGAK